MAKLHLIESLEIKAVNGNSHDIIMLCKSLLSAQNAKSFEPQIRAEAELTELLLDFSDRAQYSRERMLILTNLANLSNQRKDIDSCSGFCDRLVKSLKPSYASNVVF